MRSIRRAFADEYEKIKNLYDFIIDTSDKKFIGWKKDIYPSEEMLKKALQNKELFLMLSDHLIVASAIVNHETNPEYHEFLWKNQFSDTDVTVIHALGVHSDYLRRGIAKEMIYFILECAKHKGQKAVRLDVLKSNIPAEQLYISIGFQYCGTIPMFYKDTGWTDYKLFEYAF